MTSLDDTQPRSPLRDLSDQQPAEPPPAEDDEIESGGPGCLIWSLIGLASVSCSLLIVLLAAAAGWTAGQPVAQSILTATRSADIQVQLERIATDVAVGNQAMVSRRLLFLATLTPGVPQVPQIVQTATALYLTALPTQTLTPTSTPSPTAEVTEDIAITQSASGEYDLDALLQEARDSVALAQYDDAVETLDVILAVDGNYESATVRGLMLEALRSQALILFNDNRLAEAILRTTRAEAFGLPQDDPLRYEKYVAGLYLDAIRTIGTDYASAIRALRAVYDLGPGRYYDDVRTKLFSQYVAYGDAWTAQNEHCPAYVQYQNALTILSDAATAAKRDNANTLCLQATPTLGPGVTPQPGTTQEVAPIGVVGTQTPVS